MASTTRQGRIAGQGSNWIRKDKRLAIYLRDGLCCAYCGDTLETGADLTLDHVLACELGGTNGHTNLVTCCLSCNSSKRDLAMADWFTILRDRGVDTRDLGAHIRSLTERDLKPFRVVAKNLIATRTKAPGAPITALCK
jgi:hypothetical protein